jgi:parallel beta-helix repeat protein
MKKNRKKVKIFCIIFCASVLLLSTKIPAEYINFEVSNITETVIYVDSLKGSDIDGNGSIDKPYASISKGISESMDTYIIFVYPGTYMENIVIDKNITLKGAAWEHTIIDGNQNGNVIKIAATGATIKGFTIRNSGNSYSGIDISNYYAITITRNIIQSNYYGIKLYNSIGNIITHNIISGNIYSGITSESSQSNIISDNDLSNNGLSGVHYYEESTFNEAKYNTVNSNGLNQDASFYKTSIAGGIVMDTACRGNRIISNEIESNQIGVNSGGNNENNVVYYNSFIENIENNAMDASQNDWSQDELGNYWSDYTGLDEDGDGIGDTPYTIAGGDNEDEYPLIDSVDPEPPEIEAPEKWNIEDGNVVFRFKSLDQNYPEVWFEIIWGDASDTVVEGPTPPLTGVEEEHGYEFELQYTVRAKTVAIDKNGKTVKSSWAEHKIILPKLEQSSKEKNENQMYSSNKPILFSELIEKISRFFDKNFNSLNLKHTTEPPFSQIPNELSIDTSNHFFDICYSKNLFFFLKNNEGRST